MIGAWVAEMDLPLAPAITAALHRAADQGLTGYLPAYLDAEVGRADRRLAGGGTAGTSIRPTCTRSRPWSAALRIVIDQLTDPTAPVVLPVPAYMPFLAVPGLSGRELITVPMRLTATGTSSICRRSPRR